jgi:adenosylmethionine-8-amino-7-oxononanoate aminotransferase
VVEAVCDQLRRLTFAHPSRWFTEIADRAAELLGDITPGDCNNIFFVSGGSEAVESALKLTRQYFVERDGKGSGKHLIIGRWNSYHGATLGTIAVGGNIPRRRLFTPMVREHPKIPPHYCYRCPYGLTYPSCNLSCAHELKRCIERVGAEHVAGFIAEPVVGSTVGALVPPDEYWPLIRDICDHYDILLLADEIMTGIGRTGSNFAVDHWNTVPDILISAKGLAGGYVPAGAIAVGENILEVIRKGSGKYMHGYTYNANPVSCAAVHAVLSYIKEHQLVEHGREQGGQLGKQLQTLAAIPIVGDVRGMGLMWGIELVEEQKSKQPFSSGGKAAELVTAECMQRGLVVYPGSGMVDGLCGDNILIAPPLTVTTDQIGEIVTRLADALDAAGKYMERR